MEQTRKRNKRANGANERTEQTEQANGRKQEKCERCYEEIRNIALPIFLKQIGRVCGDSVKQGCPFRSLFFSVGHQNALRALHDAALAVKEQVAREHVAGRSVWHCGRYHVLYWGEGWRGAGSAQFGDH